MGCYGTGVDTVPPRRRWGDLVRDRSFNMLSCHQPWELFSYLTAVIDETG